MQSINKYMKLYEYQMSRSVIDLRPYHSDSIFLNFFSPITADFNTSSALRWVVLWLIKKRCVCFTVWTKPMIYTSGRFCKLEPPHDKTSEDSDQPGHPPSLIRVFAVRMKKAWVLSYPLSAQRRLWSESSLGAQSLLLVLSCRGSNFVCKI